MQIKNKQEEIRRILVEVLDKNIDQISVYDEQDLAMSLGRWADLLAKENITLRRD